MKFLSELTSCHFAIIILYIDELKFKSRMHLLITVEEVYLRR